MIFKIPPTTDALLKELAEGIRQLPAKDKNAFVLDLLRFCTEWQFAYLAIKDAEKNGH